MTDKASSLKSQVQSRRVADVYRIRELEERIEILEAQLESLKLELCYKNDELEEMQQELRYTNQELCRAYNSKPLTLEQAEKLVSNLLATERPLKDALAELLTAISNVPVEPVACFTNQYDEIKVESAA